MTAQWLAEWQKVLDRGGSQSVLGSFAEDDLPLEASWRDRVVAFATPGTAPGRGLCLDPHDCVVAFCQRGK
jgi:hypothetical protein